MSESNRVVGFIGVGKIGRPMARRILRTGMRLHVLDIDESAVQELVHEGAIAAQDIRSLAQEVDIVITMLPDVPQLRLVALGPRGLAETMRPGSILIEMSTMDPAMTLEVAGALRRRSVNMLDCPVAKTVEDAKRGELTLMAGGDPAILEAAKPVLSAMGNVIVHCGELGSGAKAKLINNFIAQGIVCLASEALTLGVKAGVSLDVILDVVRNTHAANNQMLFVQDKKSFVGNFGAGFMTRLAAKDQRLILKLADDCGVDTPIGRRILADFEETMRAGYADDDCCSIIRLREERASVKVRLDSPGS